ncbi:PDZ domain-containing protein [Paenibacillus mendelii]|uniref:PDZ domain-containing protein n=1 Tax=Paenibacillus mendelii TaxID=206163 RepID=A0ABV6JF64_9BACL|nr:PDZ domain-containing protein [Paenibacillus mendelii]MCQ6557426.1 PDZ domain-containing protein [Paenibacillus mendelii]
MTTGNRLYITGYVLVGALAVCVEISWLGDPVRWGDLYWIDQIQWLSAILVLIPLLWLLGALAGLVSGRGQRWWIQLLRWLIVSGSACLAVYLVRDPYELISVPIIVGGTLLLTIIDLVYEERRRRKGWPWRSTVVLAVIVSAGVVLLWPTSYQVTSPGYTINMNRYAAVDGGEAKGSIDGVLVIERPAFPIDWLYAALFPHVQLEKRDTSISIGEIQQAVRLQRVDANQIGSALAFHKLGIGRGVVPSGVQIVQLTAGSPADGILEPGDLIVAMNDQPLSSYAELAGQMSSVQPGEEVKVTLIRNEQRLSVTVKTKESGDDPTKAVFGIEIEDHVQVDLPKDVHFRSYLVYQGGPSHGAVLALTLMDQLTPGGVTYGNRIAGTGTIDAQGNVGPIGGIEQKAYAVERSQADVFFVPAGQEADARKGAASLNIVPVHTLDEMLDWLKANPKSVNR